MVRKGLYRLGVIALLSWGMGCTVPQAQEKDLGVRPTRGELQGVRVYDNIHAIIVGVNQYQYLPVKDWLQYAVVDARAFQQVLINEYGVPPQNITLLLDKQATRQAIREAIRDLIRSGRVGKNDMVILFFSMHGQIVRVNGEDLGFLIPYDAQLNFDIVDERQLRATCIALDASFWQDLEKCPAKHIAVFTDACYSGAIARNPRPSQHELRVLASERAVQVIASSTRKQPSFELTSLGHGVFTYALLETLREWARENPGLPLRLTDLFTRVRSRVIELMGENKQLPVFQNRVAGGECLFIPLRGTHLPNRVPALTPAVKTFQGHAGWVWSVAFSPSGQWLASAGSDTVVRVWRVSDGQLAHMLIGHTGAVVSLAFSPNEEYLASGSRDKTVRLWRTRDWQSLDEQRVVSEVNAVSFSPDGRLIALACSNDLIMYNHVLLRGYEWLSYEGSRRNNNYRSGGLTSVAFAPDGRFIASGSEDTTVQVWQVSNRRFRRVLRGHTGVVHSVAFSPDAKFIVSGSEDRTVRVWQVSDWELVHTLTGHENAVTAVAFSHDAKFLASASVDATVRIWRVSDWKLVDILTGHTGWVNSIAFSPDGQWLASASSDGTIRLWRLTGIR